MNALSQFLSSIVLGGSLIVASYNVDFDVIVKLDDKHVLVTPEKE